MEYLANDENSSGEYGFIFDQIIPQIDFPIIATDREQKEIILTKNVDYDTTLPDAKKMRYFLIRRKIWMRSIPQL
jgi:hypothetical protein